MCKDCFYYAFEEEIHRTIIDAHLFTRGDRVAVGASGGKGNVHFMVQYAVNPVKTSYLVYHL